MTQNLNQPLFSPRQIANFFFVLILANIVLRLIIVIQPIDKLIEYVIADDMFYYLTIAKQFLAGNGISFDGLTRTNGFHPLYMGLTIIVQFLIQNKEVVVRALLILSACWGIITGLILAFIVHKLTHQPLMALITFVAYAYNPFVISQDLNGLETSLYGMFLSLSFLVYLIIKLKDTDDFKYWVWLGVLVGLTLLARTESIFFPLIIIGDVLWLASQKKLTRKKFTNYIIAGITALVIISPWLIWNFYNFGTVQQDSGKIFPLRKSIIFEESLGHPPTAVDMGKEMVKSFGWNIYILGNMLAGIPYTVPKRLLIFFIVLPGVMFGFLIGRFKWSKQVFLLHLKPFLFGIGFSILVFSYYTFYHQASHWRYFYALLIVSLPMAVLYLNSFNIHERISKRAFITLLLTLVLFLTLSSLTLVFIQKNYPAQKQVLSAARWISQNLPEDSRVGAFNAGILGYWSDRQIINLDGVVNKDMYEVLAKKQLWSYIKQKRIQYLCDHERTMIDNFRVFSNGWDQHHFELLHTFYLPSEYDHVREKITIYKIISSSN